MTDAERVLDGQTPTITTVVGAVGPIVERGSAYKRTGDANGTNGDTIPEREAARIAAERSLTAVVPPTY